MDPGNLKELSRDELRSKVSRLKIMTYNEMKQLSKQQLINALREHERREGTSNQLDNTTTINQTNNPSGLVHGMNKVNKRSNNNTINLKDIFPFDKSIFSNYNEFKNVVKYTIYENENNLINLDNYLERIDRRNFDYYLKIVSKQLNKFFDKKETEVINDIVDINIKINFTLEVEMSRLNESHNYYIRTKTQALLIDDDRKEFYRKACKEMIDKIEIAELKGSGWKFKKINALLMLQSKYKSFKGSSYLELPKWIKDKKAIINIKNNDEKCFMWCILAALHPVEKNAERISNYQQYENELKFDGINFPIKITDVPKIEKLNNLVINIFSSKEREIIPIYISNQKEIPEERIIDLFMIKDSDESKYSFGSKIEDSNKSHYCWVKHINRLLNNEISRDHANFICRRCFVHFRVKDKYDQHVEECSKHKQLVFKEPSKDYITFKNIEKSQKIPYVIYADFESIIKKYDSVSNNPNESWTETTGKHIASAFCAIVIDFNGKIMDIKVYRGYNAGEKFNEYIIKKCDELINSSKELDPKGNLKDKNMKPLSTEQWKLLDKSKNCPECKEVYSIKNYKVRDHDHFSGEFRGPLCNKCNLKNKKNRFIPVFFHNLKGYDSHLILSSLNKEIIKYSDIKLIPNNSEKYISFSYVKKGYSESNLSYEIRFLDSFAFMASSLDALTKNLTDNQFKITKQHYKNQVLFKLMKRKGIYPYEYMDSFKKYEEIEFPSKEMFYDKLNNKHINDEDYEFAKSIYKKFECNNLGDYTDIYMVNDVLMLADVFETFRATCMSYYKLDPCWYYTAPGLAWDAMLKITRIKLQTVKDYEMYLFIEKGIRGGMVNAVKRYAKANNKYLINYNSDEANKYLMYLDANNLYGWAMIQKLPYDELNFEAELPFLTYEELEGNFNILKTYIEKLNKMGKGCILEVDLEYCSHLHIEHNDFPFCPENTKVNNQKVSKLMNTLYDKKEYIIHYKNLIQVLDHGLKLKKIHRILTFKENNWMEKYIMLNTNLRKQSKNDFERDFFKLMNNAVFGKTMENIRNRVDIHLVTDRETALKYIKKPNYKNAVIINKDLLSIEMEKTKIEFDKPIYVGFSILDLSKYLMFEFHYDIMKERYNDKIRLCYQDTDSLIYEVETEDIYKDLKEMKEYFDFSDYPKNNPLYDEINKKVIGKFKDELNGNIMTEIVALKPKQYAFKTENGEENKKCKGIKKNVIKTLKVNDFKSCLLENKIVRKEQFLIQAKKHQIYTIKQNKVALNEDDKEEYKRYILENKIDTLAHGHYQI